MLATNPPTLEEQQQAADIVHRYYLANKPAMDQEREAIEKQIHEDRTLAAECEQLADELYYRVMNTLPDKKSKDMFVQYSELLWGQYALRRERFGGMETVRKLCAWAITDAKKLLKKIK